MTARTRIPLLTLALGACASGPSGSAFPAEGPGEPAPAEYGTMPVQPEAAVQDQTSSIIDRWEYELVPYVWFVQIDGDQDLDGLSAPLDIEFSDGEFAYGLQFAAHKQQWGVLAEVFYLDAEGTASNALGMPTDSEVEQLFLEADISYRLSPDGPIELLGGLRYNQFDNSIDVMGGPGASDREGWFDPILGARLTADLAERWSFLWRLDFGGFRAGSDFAWNSAAAIRYRASELLSVDLAYRVLDIDYDDRDFEYDAQTSGVVLGVGFHW